jgi:hypothetical protein
MTNDSMINETTSDLISAADIIIRARSQLTAIWCADGGRMPTEGPVADWMSESKIFLFDNHVAARVAISRQGRKHQNYYECLGCGNCVDVDTKRGTCEMCGGSKWQPKTT